MVCIFQKKQEPIQTSGYICNFEDLEIKSVLLDEIMKVNIKKHLSFGVTHLLTIVFTANCIMTGIHTLCC